MAACKCLGSVEHSFPHTGTRSQCHASATMDNARKECISYREFEVEANRDPKDSYCPVRLGGFEWPESKPNFEDSSLRCSQTSRRGYWNADAKLHNSRAFGAAFVSTTNCVSSLFTPDLLRCSLRPQVRASRSSQCPDGRRLISTVQAVLNSWCLRL